jgi:CubicO group peptidase (beta-lactamase class C family)
VSTLDEPSSALAGKLTTDAVEEGLRVALEEHGEAGVQVAAFLHGEPLVDTWGGVVEEGGDVPVERSTVFPIFSVSKAMTAFALHLQVDRGLVDLDQPMAAYWPEYAVNGKEALTVRHVLTHRAGVPQMPEGVTPELMSDWDWMVEHLPEVTPIFPPGSDNSYLAMTYGWLLGEVVRRTDPQSRPFGQFVADEVAAPLGMSSFWFGIPPEVSPRVATLSFPGVSPGMGPPLGSMPALASPARVALGPAVFNRPDVQAAAIPAVGGIADARSVARFFAVLAGRGELDGVRYLPAETVLGFREHRPQMDEVDRTYGKPMPVGAGGYWVRIPIVPDHEVIGQTGAGCSYGFADPVTGLSMAVVHNRMALQEPFLEVTTAIRELAASRG